eukprot:CAMPEP_0117081684 /NCGR_PEP_ID=MMETSP0472-20121206/57545_1 /TAXON_ID=693140 ORGANISM="Tiarina fusus, Strain LIS" /NCGR_SAMPLE_ID=MMETSP0472 /ASSEMBLY_ACC=CAM_ASM_000603 /LENGTH=52 /DNA_ID=CAMNT_0004809661 /DNA_START=12 /DNA_END=167 /DNA_ORIENTATION=-
MDELAIATEAALEKANRKSAAESMLMKEKEDNENLRSQQAELEREKKSLRRE